MKPPFVIAAWFVGAFLPFAACQHEASTPPTTPRPFACADSIARADGSRQSTTCDARTQYCFEASGGAAISHGAHCKPLPTPTATCDDLRAKDGGRCDGDTATGLRVQFAFP